MTVLLLFSVIISVPVSIIFGIACTCMYLNNEKDYVHILRILKVSIPIALVSLFFLYCTETCNVTYKNVRVHVVDSRAFIIDDKIIDIGERTSFQYSDGDYIRKWNSQFLCFSDSGYDYSKVKSDE